ASHSPKTISLDGVYLDAKNKTYSGSATIAPFGSLVLVKTSVQVPQEEAPAPSPAAGDYYFNTTSADGISFENEMFQGMAANYLLTAKTNVGTNSIASKDELFQKERFAASLSFKIPVPNGLYTVKTYHNETWYGIGGREERPGQRVFDILLDGKVVKKSLDLFVENGNKQTILKFENIAVTNGSITLDLI